MTDVARITGLFSSLDAGQPMQSHDTVAVREGAGVLGDRYASGRGHYSATQPPKARHLTLITQDGIDVAAEWQEACGLPAFSMPQTRRNVLLDGLSAPALNALVGRTFRLGEVVLRGLELCTPCPRPSELSGQEGFVDAFDGRGGLRAEVLSSGHLRLGDRLDAPAQAVG